jgi:hypothetical protein
LACELRVEEQTYTTFIKDYNMTFDNFAMINILCVSIAIVLVGVTAQDYGGKSLLPRS